ncbi:MAG: alpha/beta hydrolase, partial [Pseudonocardia sp.]|nr:alpha/beta hydrolase [Pseudonocardia sp.]
MALDPQVRDVIDMWRAGGLAAAPGRSGPADDDLIAAIMALQGEPEPVDGVRALTLPGPDTGLPARVYRPLADGDRGGIDDGGLPVLVYLHGGELMLRGGLGHGGLDLVDRPCRALANATGAVVTSVRCRGGPGAPFPTAVRDAQAATDWFAEHAAELGGDPARIGVAGHGAGAMMAAALTQRARWRGPVLALQLLLCPLLDLAGGW